MEAIECKGETLVHDYPAIEDAAKIAPELAKRFAHELSWGEFQSCVNFNPKDPDTFDDNLRRLCIEYGGRI